MIAVVTPEDFIYCPERTAALREERILDKTLAEVFRFFFNHLDPKGSFPQGVSVSSMTRILDIPVKNFLPSIHTVLREAGWMSYYDNFNGKLCVEPLF